MSASDKDTSTIINNKKDYDQNVLIKYCNNNIGKACEYIDNFDKININFSKFPLTMYKETILMKKIIDKINLECATDKKYKPIHYICKFSTPEIIKYIIDKEVDLECETLEKWRPIHYICKFSTPEMIKYIIDKGVDLECENNERWRPIHFICRFSTPEMIKYIIDKGVDLECAILEKWRPIHFICNYSTSEMLAYIINKGANKHSRICEYNENDVNYNINDIIKKRLSDVISDIKNAKFLDGYKD